MNIMGIDVGTTGAKTIIFSETGCILSQSYIEYENKYPVGETNGEFLWEMVSTVIKEATKDGKSGAEEVGALAVSSFGESFVPIDKSGNVLMNTILYTSKNSQMQSDWIEEHVGNEYVGKSTGVNINGMYSLPCMMNLRENYPEIYEKTYKFLLIGSFIGYKLTGETKIDYSLAARTMAFDVVNKKWDTYLLEKCGIDVGKLADVVASGEVVGEISEEIANRFNLPYNLLVVAGGHDQICAAVGAGVLCEDTAIDGTGTVECITPVFSRAILESEFLANNYACVPFPVDGMYATYAFNFTGGAILKWYKDNFAKYENFLVKDTNQSVYAYLDTIGNDGPTDIIVLPHFAGSATPDMNSHARGAFLGLTNSTDVKTLYRALIEGVTYEMRYNLEKLSEFGINIDYLHAVGGGAKSAYWLQIKADIMGKKIISLNIEEAGIAGAAMLAGIGCGIFKSLDEAENIFVKKIKEYVPNPNFAQVYNKNYERYKLARVLLKDLYK